MRWTTTVAECGSDLFGGQVFKRGGHYFARAWDHRKDAGALMVMVARRSLKAACAAVERWMERRK